jgi:hypothetical protein
MTPPKGGVDKKEEQAENDPRKEVREGQKEKKQG